MLRFIKGALQAIVHIIKMYRYNNKYDYLLLIGGITFSICTAFGLPLFAVVAGDTIDAFDEGADELAAATSKNKDRFLIIGFSMLVLGWISFTCWQILGERVSMRFR